MKQPALRQIPSTTKPVETDDNLKRAVVVSIGAHVAVLMFFVLRAVIYPSEPMRLENAIRVDMVALPDKGAKIPNVPVVETKVPPPPAPETVKPEPPAPEQAAKPELPKPPVPKAAPIEPPPKPDSPKVNLNKTKRDQEAALKRLEALEKIEQMSKNSNAATSKPASRPPQPVKGNEISKGNSLTGMTRLEHQGYLQTVDSAVKGHWGIPAYLRKGNYSARARLYVDADGTITKRSISKSSGNDIYDSRVLATIDSANPLPAPPKSLVGILSVDGIELEFVPE
jgi:colicin import membrane protein